MGPRRGRVLKSKQARSSPWWAGPWPIIAVVGAIALVLAVFVMLANRSTTPPAPAPSQATSVAETVTHLDVTRSLGVGTGGLKNPLKPAGGPPLLSADGRVRFVYVGADFCPYCAAERWSVVVALSRFGTLSGLQLTTSSSSDIYPNTPTFTFQKAALASTFVAFEATETQTRTGASLQSPTSEQLALIQKYDPAGSIPFVDVGNVGVGVGSGYLPDALGGKSWADVADELSAGSSPLARSVLGNANWLTAAICKAGGDKAPVCADPDLRGLESQLG